MTREEEIDKAGREWFSQVKKYDADVATAFLAGAQWADRTMIEKACDWLKEYIKWNDLCTLEDIEQFRKAMKGE